MKFEGFRSILVDIICWKLHILNIYQEWGKMYVSKCQGPVIYYRSYFYINHQIYYDSYRLYVKLGNLKKNSFKKVFYYATGFLHTLSHLHTRPSPQWKCKIYTLKGVLSFCAALVVNVVLRHLSSYHTMGYWERVIVVSYSYTSIQWIGRYVPESCHTCRFGFVQYCIEHEIC